jgi:hypothetical protein
MNVNPVSVPTWKVNQQFASLVTGAIPVHSGLQKLHLQFGIVDIQYLWSLGTQAHIVRPTLSLYVPE